MPSETRAHRVADRINRELAIMFQRKVADPRLVGLTVTGVEVDRELAYATIYVSSQGDEPEILEALDRARGYLRSQLASEIPMRAFPQLRFRWDHSPDRGARVDELLDRLQEERKAKEGSVPPAANSAQESESVSSPTTGERELKSDDS